MSSRFKRQDATGVVVADSVGNKQYVIAATTPTNSQSGFQVGCFWINTAGAAGTIFYVNTGSATSTTWLNIA